MLLFNFIIFQWCPCDLFSTSLRVPVSPIATLYPRTIAPSIALPSYNSLYISSVAYLLVILYITVINQGTAISNSQTFLDHLHPALNSLNFL